jgi:GDP-L-fucose synthase
MRRALITGHCGFVGRRFTRRLLDAGWRVTGVDNLIAGVHFKEWAFKPESSHHADFCYADVRDWFPGNDAGEYDLVVHCAAIVGGRRVIDGDPLKVATDLAIDADFFYWLVRGKRHADRKVVYFSSSAVYPVWMQGAARLKMREGFAGFDSGKFDMPDQTYGWAKLSGELLARHAAEQYGVDVVIYRPFSGYGEDQDFAYPFPSIVRRVVERENPIVIWGRGRQVRDFIYIEDVIDAVLSTMHELKPGEALNLGSGTGVSFPQLARLAASTIYPDERAVIIDFDETKPEGVLYRVADVEKLSSMYRTTTSIEEGIERTAKYLGAQR